jgi:signal peptidase I
MSDATAMKRPTRRVWPWIAVALAPLAALVIAFYAAAVGIVSLGYRTFYIPSTSMLPTLLVGDRMAVQMRSPTCAIAVSPGDIVLTVGPEGGEHSVRRVVGLAGDHVRIDGEGLEVNGVRVTGPVLETLELRNRFDRLVILDVAEERLAGSKPWRVYAHSPGDWGQAYDGVVPEGHVFALGDNRANAADDRYNGPTPVDAVVGKPVRVTFTLAEGEDFWQWRDLRVRDAPSCAA